MIGTLSSEWNPVTLSTIIKGGNCYELAGKIFNMFKVKKTDWTHRLTQLYTQFIHHQDKQNANKIIDILAKLTHNELHLVFCGHFSAGKSTLLNELFGQPILPTSPIPTSANIVKVKKGSSQITLRFADQTEQIYQGAYTEVQFQSICKQGGEITEIELVREDIPLPKGVTLVDTPGIDSTDPQHRQITEDALHLADMIYYVMDYNHVQAETNLQFIKQLTARSKNVTLIVNQIDKHREMEISFAAYRESMITSLTNWDIHVDQLFFLSLKAINHPENQLTLLQKQLDQLIHQRKQLQIKTMDTEVTYLIQQHLATLTADQQHADVDSLLEQQTAISNKIEQLDKQLAQKQVDLINSLENILQNAYLMPAAIRDLAYAYLASLQKDFKVGLFFTKTKTSTEQKKRRDVFYQAIVEVIETQIQNHLFLLLERFAQEQDLWTDELGKQIQTEMPTISQELLQTSRHDGAVLTGNYLLTYTEELSKRVKSIYRFFAKQYVEQFFTKLALQVSDQKQELVRKQQQLTTQIKHAKQAQVQEAQLIQYEKQLHAIISGEKIVDLLCSVEELLSQKSSQVIAQLSTTQVERVSAQTRNDNQQIGSTCQINTQQQLAYFDRVIALLKSQPKLASFYETLKAKRTQLETKHFTVVLFGAFSAGKSSFINALIGKAINPVSPHPTTATITKVCPPNDKYHHGQGVITYKSAKDLCQELKQIYHLFQHEVADLATAISGIDQLLQIKMLTPSQKLTVPYLKAVKQGFSDFQHLLGNKSVCSQAELANKISNEAQACFIQVAEFYYDSAFAKLGITLVDTPGADSIHARHTDVAFQYMKEADAILYLTYYNHAFSGADREFLTQLGRVQDVFTSDKMFFMINAADLATSQQELDTVVSYVGRQLLTFGLRQPRLFAISSLEAMETKTKPSSGMIPFEKAFLSFIQEDLQTTFMETMHKTVQQADKWIEQMKITTQLSSEEKEKQKIAWMQEQIQINRLIREFTMVTDRNALLQELKELLYYIRQRLFLRFSDVFVEFINPSVITHNGRAGKKQLSMSMDELYLFMARDVTQELRALSLRLEYWIQKRLSQAQKLLQEQWQANQPNFVLQEIRMTAFPVLQWNEQIAWHTQVDTYQTCLPLFKNKKDFFERDGKKRIQAVLEKGLQAEMATFLQQEEQRLIKHFSAIWDEQIENWKVQCHEQLISFFHHLLGSTMQNDSTLWADLQQQLAELKND